MDWGDKLASILVTKMANQSRGCLPQTTRSEFAEKLVDYIVRHGSVTEQELYHYVGNRYSIRDVKDMLAQALAAGRIVRTLNGYAAPPKPNKT
jgi:hypothetical protein